MRIALFDIDVPLIELARAAARTKEHQIVLVSEPGDFAAEVLELFPAALLEPDWEALLVAGAFDVLVVGRSPRELTVREELLRRSVQEGVPLVTVQPPCESIVMHELAMIQKDTRSLLLAWNPSQHSAAAQRFIADMQDRAMTQLIVQQHLRDNTRSAVIAQLARDTNLLQSIAGPLDRVTALGPPATDKIATLAVTFAGQSTALVQWVLQTTSDSAHGKLSITSETQIFTLDLPAETSDGDAMLRDIQQNLAADPVSPTIVNRWQDACHAGELAEGAQQSLRRGRTIQLHFEEHSEQQTFKGVMAIGGCSILLLTLLTLPAMAVMDSLGLPFGKHVWWRLWPIYLLAPAVLLLAAQSLWRVFATQPRVPTRPKPANEGE